MPLESAALIFVLPVSICTSAFFLAPKVEFSLLLLTLEVSPPQLFHERIYIHAKAAAAP